MLLYLIRHGDADTPAGHDDERVLSKKGIRVTTDMAKLLKVANFEKPELIITSPLVRAKETAQIMREEFAPKSKLEVNDVLRPSGSIDGVMSLLASKTKFDVVMLAGHDPLFSRLVTALISGEEKPVLEMKKSAVALFEIKKFDAPRMRGLLQAFLPPKLV